MTDGTTSPTGTLSGPHRGRGRRWQSASVEGGLRASPWLALAVVLVGSYAAALNTTVIGVALPGVADDLGRSSGPEVDWVITAFLLGVVLVQPATGWWADRCGRAPVYVASLGLFGVGALACALAPNMAALVAGRFVQGIGGGALMPVGMTIVFERFPPHRRGTALGVWGVGIAGAPAAGPPLGGWLVTAAGWRWLFAVFVIVAALAGFLAAWLLRDSGFRERRRLDSVGWAFASLAVVTLVVLSRQAGTWGFDSPLSLGLLVVGASAAVAFLRRSLRRSDAIVDLSMFRTPTFTIAILVSGLLAVAQFARLNFLPVELQVLRGLDAQHVGMLLAPAALGIAVAMPLGGWMADRIGTRVPTLLGLCVVTTTMWALAHLGPEDSEERIVAILVVQGVGTGFASVPTTVAAMNSVPARYTAQASAVKNLDRQLAGVIGVAVLGAVLVADLGAVAPARFEPATAQAAYNNVFMLGFWAALAATALAMLMPGRRVTRAHHDARLIERDDVGPASRPASTSSMSSGRRPPGVAGPGGGGGPSFPPGSHPRPSPTRSGSVVECRQG